MPYCTSPLPYWWAARYLRWRIIVFVIVLIFAGALLWQGRGLEEVLGVVCGVGLAGAVVIGWVTDSPAPAPSAAPGTGR